jgi:hypothetical protein
MRPTLQSHVQHGGRTGGPVERVEPRISGNNPEPLRGSFPTNLDDIASRLNAASRVTIAGHGVPSDTKQSPTKAPTRRRKDYSTRTQKLPLTCRNTSAPGRIRTCDTGFRRACKLT